MTRYALVVSQYHDFVTARLQQGALAALTSERRAAIAVAVAAAGYDEVEISDQPFRSGSLNASFTKRLAVAS